MSAKKTVMVVDDQEEIRLNLRRLLELDDYPVIVASNGREALDILESLEPSERPGLILLDIMMPVMDGQSFLNEIEKSQSPRLKDLKIVVITAAAHEILGPYVECLRKPLDANRLLDLVEQYCSPKV